MDCCPTDHNQAFSLSLRKTLLEQRPSAFICWGTEEILANLNDSNIDLNYDLSYNIKAAWHINNITLKLGKTYLLFIYIFLVCLGNITFRFSEEMWPLKLAWKLCWNKLNASDSSPQSCKTSRASCGSLNPNIEQTKRKLYEGKSMEDGYLFFRSCFSYWYHCF